MNIDFSCPRCDECSRVDLLAGAPSFSCPKCSAQIDVPPDAYDEQGTPRRCLVCPSTDLFVRKDFPQRLGIAIVGIGFVGSSIAWGYRLPLVAYGVLFATAAIDVILYLLMGNALVCYRCNAHYRPVGDLDGRAAFDLQTHERYRQQAARIADQKPAARKPPVQETQASSSP
jgi:hypothetical protein